MKAPNITPQHYALRRMIVNPVADKSPKFGHCAPRGGYFPAAPSDAARPCGMDIYHSGISMNPCFSALFEDNG
jgi:hypothetical protein